MNHSHQPPVSQKWNSPFVSRLGHPAFHALDQVFGLGKLSQWPNASGLNELLKRLAIPLRKGFVDQAEVKEEWGYYEQIIFERKVIPTREDNWHDLFNGLIWLQYPKTKQALNEIHMADIVQSGVSPRTARRNRVTHFDECGMILAVTDDRIVDLLSAHDWLAALYQYKEAWGREVVPMVFGHANLEMLLEPFIGLTGKWLAIKVDSGFAQRPYLEQCSELDDKLHQVIVEQQVFSQPRPLKPLPLLGIPGWWEHPQDPAFYQDQAHFRPKSKKR